MSTQVLTNRPQPLSTVLGRHNGPRLQDPNVSCLLPSDSFTFDRARAQYSGGGLLFPNCLGNTCLTSKRICPPSGWPQYCTPPIHGIRPPLDSNISADPINLQCIPPPCCLVPPPPLEAAAVIVPPQQRPPLGPPQGPPCPPGPTGPPPCPPGCPPVGTICTVTDPTTQRQTRTFQPIVPKIAQGYPQGKAVVGVRTDPWTGETFQMTQNLLPPPNTEKGQRPLSSIMRRPPQMVLWEGGYDRVTNQRRKEVNLTGMGALQEMAIQNSQLDAQLRNPQLFKAQQAANNCGRMPTIAEAAILNAQAIHDANTMTKQADAEFFKNASRMGPNVFGDRYIAPIVRDIQQKYVGQDIYHNRNSFVPQNPTLGKEVPYGFVGKVNMVRFIPSLIPTQELDKLPTTTMSQDNVHLQGNCQSNLVSELGGSMIDPRQIQQSIGASKRFTTNKPVYNVQPVQITHPVPDRNEAPFDGSGSTNGAEAAAKAEAAVNRDKNRQMDRISGVRLGTGDRELVAVPSGLVSIANLAAGPMIAAAAATSVPHFEKPVDSQKHNGQHILYNGQSFAGTQMAGTTGVAETGQQAAAASALMAVAASNADPTFKLGGTASYISTTGLAAPSIEATNPANGTSSAIPGQITIRTTMGLNDDAQVGFNIRSSALNTNGSASAGQGVLVIPTSASNFESLKQSSELSRSGLERVDLGAASGGPAGVAQQQIVIPLSDPMANTHKSDSSTGLHSINSSAVRDGFLMATGSGNGPTLIIPTTNETHKSDSSSLIGGSFHIPLSVGNNVNGIQQAGTFVGALSDGLIPESESLPTMPGGAINVIPVSSTSGGITIPLSSGSLTVDPKQSELTNITTPDAGSRFATTGAFLGADRGEVNLMASLITNPEHRWRTAEDCPITDITQRARPQFQNSNSQLSDIDSQRNTFHQSDSDVIRMARLQASLDSKNHVDARVSNSFASGNSSGVQGSSGSRGSDMTISSSAQQLSHNSGATINDAVWSRQRKQQQQQQCSSSSGFDPVALSRSNSTSSLKNETFANQVSKRMYDLNMANRTIEC